MRPKRPSERQSPPAAAACPLTEPTPEAYSFPGQGSSTAAVAGGQRGDYRMDTCRIRSRLPFARRTNRPLAVEALERRLTLSGTGLLPAYDPGTPDCIEIWVDPTTGSDARSGGSRDLAIRTVSEAWRRVPVGTVSQGVRINLVAGTYPQSAVPNYWEGRHGSFAAPVILRAADGAGTARLPSLNIFDCRYFYLEGLDVSAGGGDVVHLESCFHVLFKDTTIRGTGEIASYAVPQEALKVNQSQYIFIEDCDISGAWDNAIDFVAVQYGHVVGSRIHRAGDWAMYAKGGSASLTITGNEFFDAGTGGFIAGQGTGFEFMTAPWLHYEAYDIAFTNNLVHNVEGAGMGVNGGFNILLAHNTLVNVGARSHVIEVGFGLRGCDGDTVTCQANLAAGGWGTATIGREEPIPNRNVVIVNNVVFNPVGAGSRWEHFSVASPRTPTAGSNIPSPALADEGLVIRGNLIWNGPVDHELGIANPTLAADVRGTNAINTVRPVFADLAGGDYRLADSLTPPATVAIPIFSWAAAPTRPAPPAGRTDMSVRFDFFGAVRVGEQPPGGFAAIGSSPMVFEIPFGQSVVVTEPLAGADGIVVRGGGRLILEAANNFSGGLVVEAGEVVVRNTAALGTGLLNVRAGGRVSLDVAGAEVAVSRLELADTATLDVGFGRLTIPAGAVGIDLLRSWIMSGRSGGTWTGPGITSTAAAVAVHRGVGLRILPDGSALVGFAAVGDATMDGTVDVQDLIAIKAGSRYGTSATDSGWWQGDFNFDGRVTIVDLILLQAAGLYGGGEYLPRRAAAASR